MITKYNCKIFQNTLKATTHEKFLDVSIHIHTNIHHGIVHNTKQTWTS